LTAEAARSQHTPRTEDGGEIFQKKLDGAVKAVLHPDRFGENGKEVRIDQRGSQSPQGDGH
jgi:hypothetical protein